MSELLSQVTLVILSVAALVFVVQLMRQSKAKQLSASSFSTVLLAVLVGWMVTEVVSDATGQQLGQLGEWAHFAIMVLFAATVTFQLKRSFQP